MNAATRTSIRPPVRADLSVSLSGNARENISRERGSSVSLIAFVSPNAPRNAWPARFLLRNATSIALARALITPWMQINLVQHSAGALAAARDGWGRGHEDKDYTRMETRVYPADLIRGYSVLRKYSRVLNRRQVEIAGVGAKSSACRTLQIQLRFLSFFFYLFAGSSFTCLSPCLRRATRRAYAC